MCVQKSEALWICDRKEGEGNCVAEKEKNACGIGREKKSVQCVAVE